MLGGIHATGLHAGFELIEELLHAAGDGERQDPESYFKWVVERVRNTFRQVCDAALTCF